MLLAVAASLAGCGGYIALHRTERSDFAAAVPPESARHPEGYSPAPPPVALPPPTGVVRHISARGLRLIERFEGFSSCPYWDPYGRVWTRGYGETEAIGRGSRCVSRGQAQHHLRRLIETRYEWALRSLRVALNQNQWDALCSFVWNLGAGIFRGTSVGYYLRRRQWSAAASAMLQYDHAGGVVLAGLRIRREVEARLFLSPERRRPGRCRKRCRPRRRSGRVRS
jgi:lysozyme